MFGRKGLQAKPVVVHSLDDVSKALGHVATLEHAKAAGELFFELLYREMAQTGDAVCTENFVGLLASAGGVACISTSLREYELLKMRPHGADLLREQKIGGESYFIGDLPTRYLYEHRESVLNIALPYAMKHGATITHDFLHEPVAHAMGTVGTPAFGVPRLPADHTPGALPIDLAHCAFPQADHCFDTVGLAEAFRPAALGFAIGKAIDTAAGGLDALILARIAVECAVPMSMIDPSRFLPRMRELKADAQAGADTRH